MKKYSAFIAALYTAILLCSCDAQVKTSLSADDFASGINGKDSVQLLDVRTPGEFQSGHLQHALLADWTNKPEFSRRIQFIDKNKPVYVYCLSGGRSAAAAKKMREEGFENVYELAGGINAWKAAGKPLTGESNAPQMPIETFNSSIANGTVLVDFGASWCPPCRQMEPVLTSLQKNNGTKFSLVKVDGSKDTDVLKAYGVTALPVFIVFKNGKQVWRKDGVATEQELAAQL